MMTDKKREPGNYWVKIRGNEEFSIAEFKNNLWVYRGLPVIDILIEEIDERQIVRQPNIVLANPHFKNELSDVTFTPLPTDHARNHFDSTT